MNQHLLYLTRLYTRIANYASLNLAFVAGLILRFPENWPDVFASNNYIALLLFINLSWAAVSNLLRYYRPARLNFSSKRRLLLFIQLGILHVLLVLAFNGIIKTYFSRLFLIYFYFGFWLFIPGVEYLVRAFLRWYQKQKGLTGRILIAGKGQTVQQLAHYFIQKSDQRLNTEVLVFDGAGQDISDELKRLHAETPVTELYLSISSVPEKAMADLSVFCENNLIRIRLLLDYPKWESKPLEMTFYDSIPVINVPFTPLDESGNKILKRAFDILFSLLVITVVLSWLYPLIAFLIKLSSKGPVLFRQQRNGLENEPFECLKFRSMRLNDMAHTKQATQDDPRITRLGRFLRNTSLDELPQFINVLRGEMSVVGPRPHMLKHTEEYSRLVGEFMQRHAIRPGVTGLAQVKGYRGEITHFEHLSNRIKYDRFYVENWSLALDLKIILLTIITVFRPAK